MARSFLKNSETAYLSQTVTDKPFFLSDEAACKNAQKKLLQIGTFTDSVSRRLTNSRFYDKIFMG